MSSSVSTTYMYSAQEHVLCYHGPLIYEAKVLKTKSFDESNTPTGFVGPHYLVHYKGWKQTWDEWVPANRLLKRTDANLAIQKQLQQSTAAPKAAHHNHHTAAAAAAAASSSTGGAASASGSAAPAPSSSSTHHHKAPGAPSAAPGAPKDKDKDATMSARVGARKDVGGTRGTKRAREEDDTNKRPEMRLVIPEVLKTLMVDDWENVTKNNQLVTLPREPTVAELLDQFGEYVRTTNPPHLKSPPLLLPTILTGLRCYFDRALGATLLYRFERVQYAHVRKTYWTGPAVVVGQEREMSAIYGAEHLLRMIVSLPQMIASTSLDAESIVLIREYANELMAWMAKEKDRIFQREYEDTPLGYQNVSRS